VTGASRDFRPIEKLDPIGIDPNGLVTITAGTHFTCVRRNSNAIFCWGQDNLNQVGRESRTPCGNGVVCVSNPAAVLNQFRDTLRALVIDAGADHTCGLDGTGAAWCEQESGQRRSGQQTSRLGQ
jgi:alpha-tubulin suppressor-like RCC1 family protein